IASSIFEWTDGEYRFEEMDQLPWTRALQSTTAELITEGTRRAASNPTFLNLVAPPELIITAQSTNGDGIGASAKLNSSEGYILSLITSPTAISDIVTLSGLPEELIRPAVCVLVALGLVTA